jgi:hypothetical protein
MEDDRPERLEQLALRVRWLDRHRRALSIVLAVLLSVLLSYEMAAAFDAPWPSFLVCLVASMFGTLIWWCIEAGLAWLTALWETEHAHLVRDRGLPRAEILQRRR